ncbi:MAG: hypothetical protein SWZ49_23620 [Cyanobacteriota bacterium]|nr:hypothetical protein [Cyanobacteriota bacterium]
MPQMKVEKKYFLVRVALFLQQIAPVILTIAEFREFKAFLKNIMAGGKK